MIFEEVLQFTGKSNPDDPAYKIYQQGLTTGRIEGLKKALESISIMSNEYHESFVGGEIFERIEDDLKELINKQESK